MNLIYFGKAQPVVSSRCVTVITRHLVHPHFNEVMRKRSEKLSAISLVHLLVYDSGITHFRHPGNYIIIINQYPRV